FAIESADRSGVVSFVVNFAACLTVTNAGAVFVFSIIVSIRGLVVACGSPRLAVMTGTLFQLLFVVALLALFVTAFASGHTDGRLTAPEIATAPITWFVAWFEVLRRSPRGSWDEVIAVSRYAILLVPLSILGALAASVLTFRRQMRRALTPLAT